MKALFPLTAALAAVLSVAPPQPATDGPAPVAGDLRVHEFRSRVFGNTRNLRVLVPDGYDAAAQRERRYPVLYLNDGQNLFDAATAVLNPLEWRVDETLRDLTASATVPPMVVVGIDNAGRRNRFKEYFPWVDEFLSPPEPDPQGTRYPDFLVDEVLPFIEARYRVSRDAAGRGIGGSSAGALAAIYAVVTRPAVFESAPRRESLDLRRRCAHPARGDRRGVVAAADLSGRGHQRKRPGRVRSRRDRRDGAGDRSSPL